MILPLLVKYCNVMSGVIAGCEKPAILTGEPCLQLASHVLLGRKARERGEKSPGEQWKWVWFNFNCLIFVFKKGVKVAKVWREVYERKD